MTAPETPDELRARLGALYDDIKALTVMRYKGVAADAFRDALVNAWPTIDALLARLTAAEADAARLAELLDRKALKTPTNSWVDLDFVMHGDFAHQSDVAEALRLHDEAVALRERPS